LLHPLGENFIDPLFCTDITLYLLCTLLFSMGEGSPYSKECLQTLLSMPQPVMGGSPNPPVHIPAYHGRVSKPSSSLSRENPQTLLSMPEPATGGSPNPPVHAPACHGRVCTVFCCFSHFRRHCLLSIDVNYYITVQITGKLTRSSVWLAS